MHLSALVSTSKHEETLRSHIFRDKSNNLMSLSSKNPRENQIQGITANTLVPAVCHTLMKQPKQAMAVCGLLSI
jgi:hypothetical protein